MRTETKRPMSFDEEVSNKMNQTEREMKAKREIETMKTVLKKVKKPVKATLRNRRQMLDQAEEESGIK